MHTVLYIILDFVFSYLDDRGEAAAAGLLGCTFPIGTQRCTVHDKRVHAHGHTDQHRQKHSAFRQTQTATPSASCSPFGLMKVR